MVNGNKRLADGRGRGQVEEGRKSSVEGAPDAQGEAGRPEQRGVEGGGPPPATTYQGFVHAGERALPSMEEGTDLQGFTPARAHLSLWEVYGELPYHNGGTHLAEGVPDNATWQSRWRWLDAQSYSWYSMPPGKVGHRFTAVLAAEWRGVLDWKWSS